MNRMLFIFLCTLASGCTTANVNKVDATKYKLKTICIEKNEKVQVSDFLSVVENGFIRHGIETSVYQGTPPNTCEFVLTYTASRGWDFKPFLNFAELRLKSNEKTIGTVAYRHSGGLALNKWASTESKIDPLIDELLSSF